ncbi:MAG: hypothetical protein Q8M25_06075 [Rhodoferax sp.]|nr:hypothetical protein [Rhodoferax sp.]
MFRHVPQIVLGNSINLNDTLTTKRNNSTRHRSLPGHCARRICEDASPAFNGASLLLTPVSTGLTLTLMRKPTNAANP